MVVKLKKNNKAIDTNLEKTKRMKKTSIILTIIFFVISGINAQSQDLTIKDIREKYKNIRDNLTSYTLTNIEILDESAEGGEGKAYFDKNDIKLIEVVWYGETGKRVLEYYFDNDSLFFAFEQLFEYNAPMYIDKETAKYEGVDDYFDPDKTTIVENRYYFGNEVLIRWLDNSKKKIDLTIKSNSIVGRKFVLHSKTMKEKLKK